MKDGEEFFANQDFSPGDEIYIHRRAEGLRPELAGESYRRQGCDESHTSTEKLGIAVQDLYDGAIYKINRADIYRIVDYWIWNVDPDHVVQYLNGYHDASPVPFYPVAIVSSFPTYPPDGETFSFDDLGNVDIEEDLDD